MDPFLQQLMGGAPAMEQSADADQQLVDLLMRRRNYQPSQHTTGLGSAMGGLADILMRKKFDTQEQALRSQKLDLAKQMAASRGAYAQAYTDATSPVQAPPVATPGQQFMSPVLSGTPQTSAPLMDRSQLEAQQQDKLRRLSIAGMLSGDPTLAGFSKYQSEEAQQREAVGESKRRFGLQQALEDRKLKLEKEKIDQDNWTITNDQVTGGFVMINKKTGQVKPIGPTGPPSRQPPLKPRDLDHDVQALSKELEGPSTMAPNLQLLQEAADKGDVAGFGPVAGRVPNMITSSAGVANRQAAGRLMAQLLQMQSGKAVSEQEVERALEANGLKRTATPEQFGIGIAALRQQLASQVAQREAGFRPEVADTIARRGGFTSSKLKAGAKTPGSTGRAVVERRQTADGRTLVKYADGTIAEDGK